MPTTPDLDRVVLVLEDGNAFDLWEEVTVEDSFLDPCQTMRLRVGADESRFRLFSALRKGSEFQLLVNDAPQISGFLDSVSIDASRSGTSVEVTGRDILSPVVDSHIDRRLNVKKGMSLADMARTVFEEQFAINVTFGAQTVTASYDDETVKLARDKSTKRAISARPSRRRRKAVDPVKEIQPRANEGAYAYFSRFAHRLGYHAWARPDGQGIILGSPCYDQDALTDLVNMRGGDGSGGGNNIERSSIRSDNTQVPSHLYVYGKSSKPGDKSTVIGFAVHEGAPFFKPFYVTDDESDDKDHADAYARYLMGKALRTACVYTVTVRGLSAPNGGIYNVDTVVNVTDEACGVDGPMWVERRVFRKSRAGTFTDLTLIAADSLLLDYYANDSLPPFEKPAAARAAAKAKPPLARRPLTGLDYAALALGNTIGANQAAIERQAIDESAPYLENSKAVLSNDPGSTLNPAKEAKKT